MKKIIVLFMLMISLACFSQKKGEYRIYQSEIYLTDNSSYNKQNHNNRLSKIVFKEGTIAIYMDAYCVDIINYTMDNVQENNKQAFIVGKSIIDYREKTVIIRVTNKDDYELFLERAEGVYDLLKYR